MSSREYVRGLLDVAQKTSELIANSGANVRPDEIEELDNSLLEISQSAGIDESCRLPETEGGGSTNHGKQPPVSGASPALGAKQNVQIVAQLAADGSLDSHMVSPIVLGERMSADTMIAGLDAWTAANNDYRPFTWQWGKEGPPIAAARVLSVTSSPRLAPEAITDHVWNNLHGNTKTHYSTSLTKDICRAPAP